mmetsp:Transcript_67111/g.119428  ORF Transcript_67111/g.119428 Transcript_67111/m.119428 type:complete len:303 (-) Transcript_67111:17-925(-)
MDPYHRGALATYDREQHSRRLEPFAAMDDMMDNMMQPFGRGGRGERGGVFGGFGGGLLGGDIFRDMDDMMAGARSSGGGEFSCKTMMFSSKMGADGQMHTEKFTSSTVGDRTRGHHETQQAYSNSNTGVDKFSLERQMGSQGRKVVKEKSRMSGEERQTDLFRGMSEEHAPEFDQRWAHEAAPHLPSHGGMRSLGSSEGGQRSLQNGFGGGRSAGRGSGNGRDGTGGRNGYPSSYTTSYADEYSMHGGSGSRNGPDAPYAGRVSRSAYAGGAPPRALTRPGSSGGTRPAGRNPRARDNPFDY